jgi:hypothetical protein
MTIKILPLNWGNADVVDLQKVFDSVMDTLDFYFDGVIPDDILVEYDKTLGPRVLFDKGPNNEYQVKLSTKDRSWAHHSYQFAHEYCHIRTNYNNTQLKTQWFEEVICELASLFALRRMSENWKENAPYLNWNNYSGALFAYAENRISDDKHQLTLNEEFHTWFTSKLVVLENDPYKREANTLIAIKLLPIFEANQQLWRAMQYFNTWKVLKSDDIFCSFRNWLNQLPVELKPLAQELIDVFKSKT